MTLSSHISSDNISRFISRVEHDNTGFGPGWYLYKVRERSRVKAISL